jgi:hypothetical protein
MKASQMTAFFDRKKSCFGLIFYYRI